MWKLLRLIHVITGVIGAFIILIMALTGILLNHRSLIGYSTQDSFNLQKVIFAIHSGFVGNTSIIWITDFGAICMIILSITGLWMWIKLIRAKIKRVKIVIGRWNKSEK